MKYRAIASTDPAEDRDFQTFGDDIGVVGKWAKDKAIASGRTVRIFETVEVLKFVVDPQRDLIPGAAE